MSQRGSSSARCRRKASRKRRLMRFRSTLPPIARGTVSPNRARQPTPSGLARQKAANSGPETRVPWSYTLRKSAVRRALAAEETGEQGGAPPARSTGFGVADGSLVAYGQLVTAAGPAARQHGPAVFALHPRAESVGLGTLAIVGLKCPFRHIGLRSARHARSDGASFDGVVCRPIQYNKRIAPAQRSWIWHGPMPNNLAHFAINADDTARPGASMKMSSAGSSNPGDLPSSSRSAREMRPARPSKEHSRNGARSFRRPHVGYECSFPVGRAAA